MAQTPPLRDDVPMLRTLALTVAALTLTACQAAEPRAAAPSATPEPETFDVRGTLTLSGYRDLTFAGDDCVGVGGYGDIRGGAPVIVRDSRGEQLALGTLEPGMWPVTDEWSCDFAFRLDDVPESGTTYSVEVGRRGEVPFTRDQAGSVRLTLGRR
jgi:hypothetical protein